MYFLSELIKGISRVLQKLLRCCTGNIILEHFLLHRFLFFLLFYVCIWMNYYLFISRRVTNITISICSWFISISLVRVSLSLSISLSFDSELLFDKVFLNFRNSVSNFITNEITNHQFLLMFFKPLIVSGIKSFR